MRVNQFLFSLLFCTITSVAYSGENPEQWPAGASVNYAVTMTFVSDDQRYATVDGGFYEVGDRLPDGARIAAIEARSVKMTKEGGEYWANLVDEPPLVPAPADARELTPENYLLGAIARLQNDIDDGEGSAEQLETLSALKDKLTNARERLVSGKLTEAEMNTVKTELSMEWMAAQQNLDALRERITNSGQGLGMADLLATQDILENAVLSTLREPIAKLQNPQYQGLMNQQSSQLLQTVGALLGEYPDYQALAEKLSQQQE